MSSDNKDFRAVDRQRVLKGGLICFNQRSSVLPCTVREISKKGARLILPDVTVVPKYFELNVELDGTWVDCEVAWKAKGNLGVSFTSQIQTGKPRKKQALQPTSPNTKYAGKDIGTSAVQKNTSKIDPNAILAGKRVLVVDDDPVFCEIAASALSEAGAEVRCADSGLEALQILDETSFDAATIDLIMPEMDGFRLMAHMRHSRGTRDIPMVVITSRHGEKAKKEATLLKIASYQIKPIVWPDLISTIAFALDIQSTKSLVSETRCATA